MFRFLKKFAKPEAVKPTLEQPPLRRKVDTIVIHHSATPRGRHVTVAEIRKWHKKRGFVDIGYHEVIYIDGTAHKGRDINKIGAHVKGQNTGKIGICVIGDGRLGFEPAQLQALKERLRYYRNILPNVQIVGHNDLAKTLCPGFKVAKWLQKEANYVISV